MLDFTTPYPSARLPVFARNLVATSHPLAAQAGLRMLAQGRQRGGRRHCHRGRDDGVEPVSNGLGSDAFCILWDGQALHGLNASGRAPAAWTPDYFHRRYGTGARTPPKRGMDSVTVPGAVSAWVALSERFGRCRLPT
jgi:gamma-glutamyltranspeptidase/glutathione hydrolase